MQCKNTVGLLFYRIQCRLNAGDIKYAVGWKQQFKLNLFSINDFYL